MIALVVALSVAVAFAAGDIAKGKALFKDTSLGTNGKSCNTCHPDGSGINGQKGSYKIMNNKLATVEDAVNFCIEKALRGKPLPKDSQKMKDIVSYIKILDGKKRKKKIIKGC
ncbi:MAG: hypothetical protein D6710_09425 [Nitrospirae bacterium]|nr:MAG: hypothetical protein D6710_09425 [Nitrospirota bacterium]